MGRRYVWALALVLAGTAFVLLVLLTSTRMPGEKRALLEAFGANPRIENVEITGRGDDRPFPFGEPYRAYGAEFRIKGRPDSRIIVAGPDPDVCTGTDHLHLDSIGPYSLSELCIHRDGVATTAAVDIGPGGHGPLPPFPIRSVDDVIDHYDDLLAYLADQPPTHTFRSRTDGEEWTRTINHARRGTGRVPKRRPGASTARAARPPAGPPTSTPAESGRLPAHSE